MPKPAHGKQLALDERVEKYIVALLILNACSARERVERSPTPVEAGTTPLASATARPATLPDTAASSVVDRPSTTTPSPRVSVVRRTTSERATSSTARLPAGENTPASPLLPATKSSSEHTLDDDPYIGSSACGKASSTGKAKPRPMTDDSPYN